MNEADKIYFAIFRENIPKIIKHRFDSISKKIDCYYSENEINIYYSYLECVDDLEALELAGRHLKKLPLLSDKFKIMIYIAETFPGNYAVFVNEHSHRILFFLYLALCPFYSLYKFLKGAVLLAVH
jgi:hypothetical protein